MHEFSILFESMQVNCLTNLLSIIITITNSSSPHWSYRYHYALFLTEIQPMADKKFQERETFTSFSRNLQILNVKLNNVPIQTSIYFRAVYRQKFYSAFVFITRATLL